MSPRPLRRVESGAARTLLNLHTLEDRLVPSLTIQFNYSQDTLGFFNDPARRQALQQAASDLESRINTTLTAIAPSAGNSWTALFNSPSSPTTPDQAQNLTVGTGDIVVFVGGANMATNIAGEGAPGGYSINGSPDFDATITNRNGSGFGPWGGSISFQNQLNWYFGANPSGLQSNQVDFYTVATHELGHVLGFGTAAQFTNLVVNSSFTGPAVTALNGSPPKLSDGSEWLPGATYLGIPLAMDEELWPDRRVGFSPLDYASLQDIGWSITPIVTPLPVTLSIPAVTPARDITVVSGPFDGSVQLYLTNADGSLTALGGPIHPFSAFGGPVRAIAADVNGDGTADLVVATGPGGGSEVRIIDGRTSTDLTAPFSTFESSFTGGIFVSAGDFHGDGHEEVVITPDLGGGPRVKIVELVNGQLQTDADFMGISDPNFRGGARTAVGDINGDGVADLVVAAGYGGGPRVALYDGTTLFTTNKTKLVPDFFAFEPTLTNGVYVTLGDMNGDGKADLIFGAGPGGGPRLLVISSATLLTSGWPTAAASPLDDLFIGDSSERGGVRVAMKEPTSGTCVILAGNGATNQMHILTSRSNAPTTNTEIDPFSVCPDGVYVG